METHFKAAPHQAHDLVGLVAFAAFMLALGLRSRSPNCFTTPSRFNNVHSHVAAAGTGA